MQQSTIDAWNGLTGQQSPQQFVDIFRAEGVTEPREMVAEYASHLPDMFNAGWEYNPDTGQEELREWTAERIGDARASLLAYLELTQGKEWS